MQATRERPNAGSGDPEVLTAADAAAFLRVPEAAIRELADSGGLPGRRINGDWRFHRRAVVRWLCRGEQAGAPAPGSAAAVLRHFGVFRDDGDLEAQLSAMRNARVIEPVG